MNFNHLLPKSENMRKCSGSKKHHYIPSGHTEASIGHVAVRFECKNCSKIATTFLTFDEYETHKQIIEKYGESNEIRT